MSRSEQDGCLEAAVAELREFADAEGQAASTRARVLAQAGARRGRSKRVPMMLWAAALWFVGAPALAYFTGQWPAVRSALAELTGPTTDAGDATRLAAEGAARVPTPVAAPAVRVPAPAVAAPAPGPVGAGQGAETGEGVGVVAPGVGGQATPARERAGGRGKGRGARRRTRPRGGGTTPQAAGEVPGTPRAARDVVRGHYRTAHRLHFGGGEPAEVLAAWDAYLALGPTGPFAVEARFNRAQVLLRLGRTAQARTALAPFACAAAGSPHAGAARRLMARTAADGAPAACEGGQ